MKDILLKKINYKHFFFASMLTFLFAFWFSMVKIRYLRQSSDFFFGIFYVFLLVGALVYFYSKCYTSKVVDQMTTFLFLLSIFIDLNYICCRNKNIVLSLLALICVNISFIIFFIIKLKLIGQNSNICSIKNKFKLNLPIICVVVVFAMLFLINYGVWITWDNSEYYSSIIKARGAWDFSFKTLDIFQMGGHTSYSYAACLLIGEYLVPYGIGARFVNEIISIITIYCFYKILIKMGIKDKKYAALCSGVFAFSPMFLGISYTINSDFPLLCFFVIFVYSNLYDNKIWKTIFVLAICYTKELGAFIMVGYFLCEAISAAVREKKFKKFFGYISEPKNLLQYFGLFLYYETLLFGQSGWTQNLRDWVYRYSNNSSKVSSERIVYNADNIKQISTIDFSKIKIFEMLLMNFNWIIMFVILFGLVILICKNKRKTLQKIYDKVLKTEILPISGASFVFIILSINYKTMVHYRYVQYFEFIYILIFSITVYYAFKEKIRYIIGGIVIIAFMGQCFYPFDPLTNNVLFTFDGGNGNIPSTRQLMCSNDSVWYKASDKEIACNCMVEGLDYNYNKVYLQNLINKGLRRIKYDETKLIIVKNFTNDSNTTFASLFGHWRETKYYYDTSKSKIDLAQTLKNKIMNEENKNDNIINMNIISETELFDYDGYSEIYYFDFDFNKYYNSDFVNQHKIIDKFRINEGLWGIDVYKIK